MAAKKIILLKITGEVIPVDVNRMLDGSLIHKIAVQIKKLWPEYAFGIVIGGGNFFRGTQQGTELGLDESIGDQIGMLATVMNGLIIENILKNVGLSTTLFCAVPVANAGSSISQQAIDHALAQGHCLIFAGGLGAPYFTTDTAAVVRGLQMGAHEIWKGTTVKGICTEDPKKNPEAELIKKISFNEALERRLTFMDFSALYLAQEHNLSIRVFDIFLPDAMLEAARDPSFGSRVYKE
jgi:uridylate kinase